MCLAIHFRASDRVLRKCRNDTFAGYIITKSSDIGQIHNTPFFTNPLMGIVQASFASKSTCFKPTSTVIKRTTRLLFSTSRQVTGIHPAAEGNYLPGSGNQPGGNSSFCPPKVRNQAQSFPSAFQKPNKTVQF